MSLRQTVNENVFNDNSVRPTDRKQTSRRLGTDRSTRPFVNTTMSEKNEVVKPDRNQRFSDFGNSIIGSKVCSLQSSSPTEQRRRSRKIEDYLFLISDVEREVIWGSGRNSHRFRRMWVWILRT
jgi:hypothetical protein